MGEEKENIESELKEKTLPPPPNLPLPTLSQLCCLDVFDSQLDLDDSSWNHLHQLLLQTLISSKVSNESIWVVSN